MSKTVSCVLLKVLILARAGIISMNSNSDFFRYTESILNKPISPRAFVKFHNGFPNEENDISVTFRWNQPELVDGVIQGYTVQCWFMEYLKMIQVCDKSISATILEHVVNNLYPNTTYYFEVRAHTKFYADSYSDLINVSTTHENPIPQLLIVSKNGIKIRDLDLKSNISLVEQNGVMSIAYSIAEHKIYWSNDKHELMILDMNENNITKIDTLQTIAFHLCIDWVARNLYWVEKNSYNFFSIIKFDLTMWENGIAKYDTFSKVESFYSYTILVLPSMGTLYGIYFGESIMQWDLDGRQLAEKNFDYTCIPMPSDFTKIYDMNTKEPLLYWLLPDLLIVTNINGSKCNSILRNTEVETSDNFIFHSLTIDKTNIYISASDRYHPYIYNLYVLKKNYALLESKGAFKYIQKIILEEKRCHELYAFDESLQSYPPTKCLTPDKKVYNVEIVMVTTNSIILNLPEPISKSGCKKYNLPSTLYTIYISHCLDNKLNKFNNFTVKTYERYYEIQNLTPLTEYKLQLTLSNFYSDRLSMDPLFVSEEILKTKLGWLDAPENVTIQALTPTIAAVSWMPPKKLNCLPVIYEVYWTSIILLNNTRQIHESLIINKTEHKIDGKFFTILKPLIPGQKYKIYVRVYPADFSNHYTNSSSKILYMYSEPNNITLNDVSINSMNISWIPSVNLTIHYELEYKNVKMQRWEIANNFKVNNGGKVMYYINNLLSRTLYEFRLRLKYPKYEKVFIWPSDGRFTFSTLISCYGDTDSMGTFIFDRFYQCYKPYIISGLVIIVIVIIVICYICCILRRRWRKNSNQALPSIITETELAILHEMPTRLHVQFNMSYNPVLQSDSDGYVLIKITHEQIKLEKLLGSGAFGLVYQGKVKNLDRTGREIPVAIKMLGKNASSEERKMFLEEARLMKYFSHKHVLRLLAVCLHPQSPSIVLELMEAGDLLQYLRDCRKLEPSDSHALRLQDLIAMCEDVARGCRYLEYLRFVHRDLACRNCLVSARDRKNRVVKIADFGLTRDIYNSNYYRKKGQALLPVRWMAPESLVVGIFTSQSDVWSFGVIMWEITSLGEQPYTGRSNLDVIDYVRTGGKLPMPLNSPSALYELMMRCWNAANDRPNFKLCLKNIIALRNNMEDALLNPLDII